MTRATPQTELDSVVAAVLGIIPPAYWKIDTRDLVTILKEYEEDHADKK